MTSPFSFPAGFHAAVIGGAGDIGAACVSAPKSGPHAGSLQPIDSTKNSSLREGSQSAIGTPLKGQLLKCYQRIAPGAAGVPFRSAMTLTPVHLWMTPTSQELF